MHTLVADLTHAIARAMCTARWGSGTKRHGVSDCFLTARRGAVPVDPVSWSDYRCTGTALAALEDPNTQLGTCGARIRMRRRHAMETCADRS